MCLHVMYLYYRIGVPFIGITHSKVFSVRSFAIRLHSNLFWKSLCVNFGWNANNDKTIFMTSSSLIDLFKHFFVVFLNVQLFAQVFSYTALENGVPLRGLRVGIRTVLVHFMGIPNRATFNQIVHVLTLSTSGKKLERGQKDVIISCAKTPLRIAWTTYTGPTGSTKNVDLW